MSIKQLSAFVENEPGKLVEMVKEIAGADVNLRAMSIADTKDFGILRLISSDNEKLKNALGEDAIVITNDVVAAQMTDEAGALYKILKILGDADINIDYMYAFTSSEKFSAYTVLRVDDVSAAETLLRENGIPVLDQADI